MNGFLKNYDKIFILDFLKYGLFLIWSRLFQWTIILFEYANNYFILIDPVYFDDVIYNAYP